MLYQLNGFDGSDFLQRTTMSPVVSETRILILLLCKPSEWPEVMN